jgi:hypothetical protein
VARHGADQKDLCFRTRFNSGDGTMTIAETIYQQSLRLPEAQAQEVLDFIEFLRNRPLKNPLMAMPSSHTEAFLAALAGGLSEDFPDDIDDSDLGIDTPVEFD